MSLIFVVIGILFLIIAIQMIKHEKKNQKECTIDTKGRIIEFEKKEKLNGSSWFPIIEYKIDNIQYKKELSIGSGDSINYAINEEIEIAYNPKEHKQIHVKKYKNFKIVVNFFLLVGIYLILLGISYGFLYKNHLELFTLLTLNIPFGLTSIIIGFYFYNKHKNLVTTCTQPINANIVSITKYRKRNNNGTHTFYETIIEYYLQDMTFIKKIITFKKPEYVIGQNIKILYNPKNPHNFHAPNKEIENPIYILFFIIGIIILIIGFFMIFKI